MKADRASLAQHLVSPNRIWYRSISYKYELVSDYACSVSPVAPPQHAAVDCYLEISPSGFMAFRNGYQWDGPSGPTIDTPSSLRASLVHDGLYQLMREGLLDHRWRREADRLFFRILREDGMPWWRRFLWWRAVRRFAARAIEPRIDRVKVAPR